MRYGRRATDHNGDFDSRRGLHLRDFNFIAECLADGGPGTDAGPGCIWADMDADGDADFHDFALFQIGFTGS